MYSQALNTPTGPADTSEQANRFQARIDTEERIVEILPELDQMIGGGLITLERAKVIMYRPHLPEEERNEHYPIDITGSWDAVKG